MGTVQKSWTGVIEIKMADKENRMLNLGKELKNRKQPKTEADSTSEKETKTTKTKQGKRSDPSYIQTGIYIQKDLQNKVKKLLLDEPDLDFSDLVNNLLEEWTDKRLSE